MQQQSGHSLGPMGSVPANQITTEQIQKYLDENKQLILAILDNQNSGKLGECAQYQAQLQKNLLYLAAIADAQPQVPAVRPQMIPQAGMPQVGVPYMQQAPIFPPKGPLQFTPQQVQELQQQQLQHHQPHMMQFPGHMGMRPINSMNAMHTEPSHARGNIEGGNAPNSSVDGQGNKQDGVGALEQTDSHKNSTEHGSGDAEPKRPEDAKSS